MTVLAGQTIMSRGIVTPFNERTVIRGRSYGISSAGYDVRVNLLIEELAYRFLFPGQFVLASTMEHFRMPNDVIGIVHDKSSWARQGIAVQNTVIEPGWRGYLTLEITNHSRAGVELMHGDPIAQIVFHMLDAPAQNPYNGKYQDQEPGPQKVRFE